MIDVKEYNLIYFCKTTKRQVNAKIIGSSHISILDNGIVTKYTIAACRRLFKGSKENRRAANKAPHVRLHISRGGQVHSKAFQEYLGESEEKLVSSFY